VLSPCLGEPGASRGHTYSYVPDMAAGLATLGTDTRAIGQVWHLPGQLQLAFAALWLVRGSLTLGGPVGVALAGVSGAITLAAAVYGVRVTARLAPRPTGPEATARSAGHSSSDQSCSSPRSRTPR